MLSKTETTNEKGNNKSCHVRKKEMLSKYFYSISLIFHAK